MSNKHPHNSIVIADRGYSLIEALVYIAVLVLVATAGVNTFLSLDTVLLRNETERAITQAAQVTLEEMVRDIRAAASADTTVPGQLTLTSTTTTVVFSVSGGKVVVDVDGTEVGPLTTDNVEVLDLSFTEFTNIAAEVDTEFVRVALTLRASSTAASSTRTYYTGAVLRGSYE